MRLKVATYNIHRCVGRDGRENFSRVATVLKEINADIVALQEVTSHHDPAEDMLAFLAKAADMRAIEGFTLTEARAPYGNALLSRLPISAVNRFDISVPGREPRGLLEAVVNCDTQKVMIWATHFGLGVRERRMQFHRLMAIIDGADTEAGMLLGDLNEWLGWSRALRALYRRFVKYPSPASFPARKPLLKLDRIWFRATTGSIIVRAHSTKMSRAASDHLPLVADVVL